MARQPELILLKSRTWAHDLQRGHQNFNRATNPLHDDQPQHASIFWHYLLFVANHDDLFYEGLSDTRMRTLSVDLYSARKSKRPIGFSTFIARRRLPGFLQLLPDGLDGPDGIATPDARRVVGFVECAARNFGASRAASPRSAPEFQNPSFPARPESRPRTTPWGHRGQLEN